MAETLRGSVLIAPSPAAGDRFGGGVATNAAGDVLVIGAPGKDNGWADRGSVYTFDWSGTAWVQRGSAFSAATADNELFGQSVALSADGNVLVVGAPGRYSGGYKGCVRTYDRTGSTWTLRGSILYAADAGDYDAFGRSVALSADGEILAVGAPTWDNAATDQGGVYIFDRSGSAWTQRGSVLEAADAGNSDQFGQGVALSSDGAILAVGAFKWDDTVTDQGVVYIYDWSGSAWVERLPRIVASDPAASRFGYAVALTGSGSRLFVGATRRTLSGLAAGAVYIFAVDGADWAEEAIITAADFDDFDEFGSDVSCNAAGDVFFVGATGWDDTGADQGGVYVYDYAAPVAPLPVVESSAHVYRLTAYITGAKDSLADYDFSLTSFSLSKRSAAVSYYAITAQFTADLIDALLARPNGIIHVLRDGAEWETCNQSHPVRFDRGPRSASISIAGTRQETIADPVTLDIEPRMVIDEGINSDGLLTLDLVPGYVNPRPGDSITWDGDTYLIVLVKHQANASSQTLAINASEVV